MHRIKTRVCAVLHAVEKEIGLDLNELKRRQRSAWMAGDYARLGSRLQIVGERLVVASQRA